MSNRDMTAAYLAAIQSQQVNVIHLVELYFSTTAYVTDAPGQVSWNSNTYEDTEGWISANGMSDTFDLTIGTVSLTFAGAVLANISLALTEDFTDEQVIIRRALLDASYAIVADPIVIWDGRIDSWSFSEQPDTGQSLITWQTSNHWKDFERVAGRRSNSADQTLFFSGDTGFDYANQSIATQERWPAA